MRTLIPHADLTVIPNAGHMAPVEQPQAVAAAMRTWIASLGHERLDDLQRLAIEAQCTRQIGAARVADQLSVHGDARVLPQIGKTAGSHGVPADRSGQGIFPLCQLLKVAARLPVSTCSREMRGMWTGSG